MFSFSHSFDGAILLYGFKSSFAPHPLGSTVMMIGATARKPLSVERSGFQSVLIFRGKKSKSMIRLVSHSDRSKVNLFLGQHIQNTIICSLDMMVTLFFIVINNSPFTVHRSLTRTRRRIAGAYP